MRASFFIFLSSFIAFTVAEKFVKIEGTSGEISQIVVDGKSRWYIIKSSSLYYSFDKGVTLNKIEIPSKKSVHTGVGIDAFDNIYVQDYNLTFFLMAPTSNTSFVFEEITLAYGKERIVSKPFSRFIDNTVHLATKSGLMYLDNGEIICKKLIKPPTSRKEINHLIQYGYRNSYTEGLFYSGGSPRYWVYKDVRSSNIAVAQTRSFVKFMEGADYYVYFTVNGEKEVYVTQSRVTSEVTPIDGIDALNIDNQTDFIVFSAKSNHKTYLYCNIGNTGTVYGLREKKVNEIIEVAATYHLDNVRIICAAVQDSRIFFGTSDGIYELIDNPE